MYSARNAKLIKEVYDTNDPFIVPLICGESENDFSCYKYKFSNDSWTQYSSLPSVVTSTGYDSSEDWGLGIVFTAFIKSIPSFCLWLTAKLFANDLSSSFEIQRTKVKIS
jgi:hypothetical protein